MVDFVVVVGEVGNFDVCFDVVVDLFGVVGELVYGFGDCVC